jgi:crotonobetainyl-CoA:carnitine CoA-transferase CaiB-like acyl-CoA transferase
MTMEQVSGMAWLCGFPDTAPGALFGPCDPGAGLHALTALLSALEHRRRTGEGRLVECPMVANALNVAAEQVITASAYGVRLDRMGNRGLKAAPQNSYATADWDDDLEQHRFVSLAVETDEQWAALKEALGRPAWAESAELATVEGRRAQHDRLDRELSAWFATRTATEAVDLLWPAGVPVAPVVHPSENLAMAPLLARQFFEHVEHPVHGDSIIVTFPFKLPGAAGPAHRRPAPLLGEHNAEILGGQLGVPAVELEALEASGGIGTEVTL